MPLEFDFFFSHTLNLESSPYHYSYSCSINNKNVAPTSQLFLGYQKKYTKQSSTLEKRYKTGFLHHTCIDSDVGKETKPKEMETTIFVIPYEQFTLPTLVWKSLMNQETRNKNKRIELKMYKLCTRIANYSKTRIAVYA